MYTIKQPSTIIFGEDSLKNYSFPQNCLVLTSKGAKNRGWFEHTNFKNYYVFDNVESNPSLELVEQILSEFKTANINCVVGIGGGSSLDVAKFVAYKMGKQKIMIPTTFGSGSEVTRISVLKVNGKKTSFHDDKLLADVAIIDTFFIKNTPFYVIKNSAIDACAQCTEAFDSKNANIYTKFFCLKGFEILEKGILNEEYEKLPLGSLLTGIGFGNSSTTLGHALSYVYSNEGISHGHALAFTTLAAHKFNKSIFYNQFARIVKKLSFTPIKLKQNLDEATDLILADRKHLDNNPKDITKMDLINLLKSVNNNAIL